MQIEDHRHFMLQIALKFTIQSASQWRILLPRRLETTTGLVGYTALRSKPLSSASLFEEWHRFHATPLSWNMLNYLRSNKVVVSFFYFPLPCTKQRSLVVIEIEMKFYSERRRVGWHKLGRVPTPRSGVVRAWRFGNGHGKDSLAKGFSSCRTFWPVDVEFCQFFSGRVGRGTRDRRARRRQRHDTNRCGISNWWISSAHSISLTRQLLPRRVQPNRRSCHWLTTGINRLAFQLLLVFRHAYLIGKRVFLSSFFDRSLTECFLRQGCRESLPTDCSRIFYAGDILPELNITSIAPLPWKKEKRASQPNCLQPTTSVPS